MVVPPQDANSIPSTSIRPAESEAHAIVEAIRPSFAFYRDQFNAKKFPEDVLDRVQIEFSHPAQMSPGTIRDALLWKFGHHGKQRIPATHDHLIAQLEKGWPAAVSALPATADEAFEFLNRTFGSPHRFITIAFLVHLLHPGKVPIIDQHNFRAVNDLMTQVRRGDWHSKLKPSRYTDLKVVAAFMGAILVSWREHAPNPPSDRELDKFLMMYGKAIKGIAKQRPNGPADI